MVAISQVATILLATVAFAAPPSHIESRDTRRRWSRPIQRIEGDNLAINHTYSTNWAGAVLEGPNGTYNSVSGTFVVPTPNSPDGSAAVWVGIDGDGCPGGLWQTGIDVTYSNGTISYDAWYEWFPDVAHFFNDITINAGNTIRLKITADSDTSGKAVIKNLSNGQTASKYITSTYALCRQSVEWIVEDYSRDDGNGTFSLVPLCNFGTVKFSNSSARKSSGSTVSPRGANIVDIQQGGPALTSSKQHSNVITVSYRG